MQGQHAARQERRGGAEGSAATRAARSLSQGSFVGTWAARGARSCVRGTAGALRLVVSDEAARRIRAHPSVKRGERAAADASALA